MPRCKLLAALLTAAVSLSASTPAEIESRIRDLLSRMTVEEKLGQMSQEAFPKGLPAAAKDQIRRGRWGSFFNSGSIAEKAEAQRIALKESRLGIPVLYGQDVIHGFATEFPIPLGESASWDPELVRQAARIAAREASAEGVHWAFAPMMDIARDPRWGRITETLGEDPYLAGVMAAAVTRGYQGEALDAPDSLAACAKHYVGYGAAEAGRDYNTTWIPEVLLRNVYLRPFQAARQAGIQSFMSAFNDLNGVPASGNELTLRKILRDEWHFDGLVVSDFTAIHEMIAHGYAADARDAALKGIRGGVDMEMVSTDYYDNGKALVDSGTLDPKLLDEAVANILRVKFRMGLFDTRVQPTAPAPAAPSSEALDAAEKLAEESIVLLKNTNAALPLARSKKIAVIGPLADSPADQAGAWSMNVNRAAIRTPLAALRQMLGNDRVIYAQGLRHTTDETRAAFPAALAAARAADAVVLFIGEEAKLSGEASSRSVIDLPGAQEALVNEIAQAGKPMIAVIMAGRPLTFHKLAERLNAVLYAWHPGTMGGPAIARLLEGDAVPSGKLTVTFPRSLGQIPIYYDHMSTGRPAEETGPNAKEKYRSKYIDVSNTPEYPFGYGLSYSQFRYSNVKISAAEIPVGASFTVSADIANEGKFEADEIAELYTRQLAGSLTRPVRELRAFRRVHLKPGEKQTVSFDLSASELAFYGPAGELRLEPGAFQAWIASDSASGQMVQFQLVK